VIEGLHAFAGEGCTIVDRRAGASDTTDAAPATDTSADRTGTEARP